MSNEGFKLHTRKKFNKNGCGIGCMVSIWAVEWEKRLTRWTGAGSVPVSKRL